MNKDLLQDVALALFLHVFLKPHPDFLFFLFLQKSGIQMIYSFQLNCCLTDKVVHFLIYSIKICGMHPRTLFYITKQIAREL